MRNDSRPNTVHDAAEALVHLLTPIAQRRIVYTRLGRAVRIPSGEGVVFYAA